MHSHGKDGLLDEAVLGWRFAFRHCRWASTAGGALLNQGQNYALMLIVVIVVVLALLVKQSLLLLWKAAKETEINRI